MPLRKAILAAKRPVALTGAGISAPSGVPTFQAEWKGKPMRDFLSRAYCRKHPAAFFELYCAMEAWGHVAPNAAHLALAALSVPVITQNIDGLHQQAGSREVIELHGNLRIVRCPQCGCEMPAEALCAGLRPLYAAGDERAVLDALHCACGGRMDTDVVLYGDAVRGLEKAAQWIESCDLLVVIGTSLTTYPASALPDMARQHGAKVLMEDRDCLAALAEQP